MIVRSKSNFLWPSLIVACACSSGPDVPTNTSGGAMSAAGGGMTTGSGGTMGSGGASSGGSVGAASGGHSSATGGEPGSGGATLVGGVPTLLSETGLFAEDGVSLGEGVRAFTPRYKLWTDSAAKRRWIYLPPGSQIDTSDMDYWNFPPGTKLWKEFARDGVVVETRLLYKAESGSWKMMPYLWRDDMSDADAIPDGLENAKQTAHDVPSASLCADCHAKVDDRVLGFGAIQLSGPQEDPSLLSLDELKSSGWLTVNPEEISMPGDETAQAALGYLHVNCGHCHNPGSSVAGQVPMFLWLNVDELGGPIEETQTYKTTVGQVLSKGTGPSSTTHRILAGDLEASGVYARMASRGEDYSMPPLGTEDPDAEGLKALESWILSLNP